MLYCTSIWPMVLVKFDTKDFKCPAPFCNGGGYDLSFYPNTVLPSLPHPQSFISVVQIVFEQWLILLKHTQTDGWKNINFRLIFILSRPKERSYKACPGSFETHCVEMNVRDMHLRLSPPSVMVWLRPVGRPRAYALKWASSSARQMSVSL